ncbi:MAG: hypothetical protein M1812_004785 [Candelaria pacifica]|nr:MAG: hypothetical protein M1812_004785 [Candelaria pacifica]
METIKTTAQQAVSAVINGVNNVTNGASSTHSNETILITGASGFVAAHVLNAFLSHGYNVRGTVRSEETANKVRKTHGKYGDKLSFAIVKDVAAPGAFDEAVKGVDGVCSSRAGYLHYHMLTALEVIHTASPFQTSVEDNERDLLNPAINGTTSILHAINTQNPSVRRVVITSSFASIINMEKGAWPGHTYTEADWNPVTLETAKSADGSTAYCASKTFAEKAAFEFVERHHPMFSVSTICPPMVYGPNAHAVSNLEHLNTSSADMYRLINGSEKTVPETSFFAYVDVRDVAEAHRLAYEIPQANGQRYFTTGGNYTYQQIVDIIRKEFPEVKDRTPEGHTGASMPDVYKVSNDKARKELGMTFRSLEETVKDTVKSLIQLEKETGRRA